MAAKVKAKRNTTGLRPAKKGEVRNPKGVNGYTKLRQIADLIDAVFERKVKTTHGGEVAMLDAILTAQALKAAKGDTRAAQLLLEYRYGKPAQTMDVTSGGASFAEAAARLATAEFKTSDAEATEEADE